jgi:hypothetical protein
MKTKQFTVIESKEVVSLDYDTTGFFIRLACGSEIILEEKIIDRLLNVKKAELELLAKSQS